MITLVAYLFENDVELYGTQTVKSKVHSRGVFENDVELYGTQTNL